MKTRQNLILIRFADMFYHNILQANSVIRELNKEQLKANISAIVVKGKSRNSFWEKKSRSNQLMIPFKNYKIATEAKYLAFFFDSKTLLIQNSELKKLTRKLKIKESNYTLNIYGKEFGIEKLQIDNDHFILVDIKLLQKAEIKFRVYTNFKTHISEEFLHYIWKNRLFLPQQSTDSGEAVEILEVGEHNFQSGADFFNATVNIDGIIWKGNVEIHLKSSDWYLHNHHKDKAYNNVILHVAKKHNKEIISQNGNSIPSIELNYPIEFEENFKELMSKDSLIVCSDKLKNFNPNSLLLSLNRFGIERLERKSEDVFELLKSTKNNWEQSFNILIAKYFGSGKNGFVFEYLIRSFDQNILHKHSDNLKQIEALLYGQAGFLEDFTEDNYFVELQAEYKFLQNKYKLKALNKSIWNFLRVYPTAFPTIRISQLASIFHQGSKIHALLSDHQPNIESIYQLFEVRANSYWDSHYRFGQKSKKTSSKKLGKTTINQIIINAICPYLFSFANYYNKCELKEYAISLVESLESESNHITKTWESIGISAKSAFQSQSLIQLSNEYCKKSRCLSCPIGARICSNRL